MNLLTKSLQNCQLFLNFFVQKKMEPKFSIIKKSWLWISLWAVLTVLSWIFFISNVRYSEEFTSGVSLWVNGDYSTDTQKESIENFLKSKGYEDSFVYLDFDGETTTIKVQTRMSSDEAVSQLSNEIKEYMMEEQMIDSTDDIVQQKITWPSVWSYMQKTTVKALIIWLIFIIIYLLFSFAEIRNYISPASLGLVVIATTIFDISLPAWAYGLWMAFNQTIQVDSIFVIALLTIMWYCINDTIVIFDRIRENLKNKWATKNLVYGEVFEQSLWQTMRRSLATSISTLLVVIAMFIFGTWIIQTFSFVIGVWIIFGTFGSIFLAAPIAYLMTWKFKKEKNKL